MPSDTAPASVRRPRETLGVLSNNVSAIPMPSSAMKRSSSVSHQYQAPHTAQHKRSASASRMSLMPTNTIAQPQFHRTSSGNMGDAGPSTARRPSTNLFASTSRRSIAPGGMSIGSGIIPMTPAHGQSRMQDSTQRRSSVFQNRPSTGASGHHSFFSGIPTQPIITNDPRELKSAATKARLYDELMAFLASRNCELSQFGDRLKNSPHMRDFEKVFEFIHHLIDPATPFHNRDQVLDIIKDLRYPYAKSINKSHLAAISSNNWWMFLAMLHWMTELVIMMDNFKSGTYDDAYAEAGFNVTADKITFDFVSDGYRAWLDGTDEGEEQFEQEIERMGTRFDEATKYEREIRDQLEQECKALEEQLDEMGQIAPRLAELESNIKNLGIDDRKTEEWITETAPKVEAMRERNNAMRENIANIEKELAAAEEERLEYQKVVDERGIAIADIDRMNNDRLRLNTGIESMKARLGECIDASILQETEVYKRLDELKATINTYNTLCWQIEEKLKLATQSSRPSKIILTLPQTGEGHADILLADGENGYQADQVLDLSPKVKEEIIALRREINQRRSIAVEKGDSDRDLLHKTFEAMENTKAEVEKLTHLVTCAEQGFQREKEITTEQKHKWEANIEKMEMQLTELRLDSAQNAQDLEQEELIIKIELEQLQEKARQMRDTLAIELERMVTEVGRFKGHIQQELGKYENLATMEVEKELEETNAMAVDEAGVDDVRDA